MEIDSMSEKVKFIYELTGQRGGTLYEALREKDFEALIEREREYYMKETEVGGEIRNALIEWLPNHLSASAWEEMKKMAGVQDLSGWLKEHTAGEEDDNLRQAYTDEQIGWLTSTQTKNAKGVYLPLLWEHLDTENDAQVALFFNLIHYPAVNKKGRFVNSKDPLEIPAAVARKIKKLSERANILSRESGRGAGSPPPKDQREGTVDERMRKLYEKSTELEFQAVSALIAVKGFYCGIHGEAVQFERAMPRMNVITCPSCGHPICPECANAYEKDPSTIEEARAYMDSCDEVSGMAWCGQCGDWGVEFMLRFLRLKRCPIPGKYITDPLPPREARYVATNRVSQLPNFLGIVHRVAKSFRAGISGIIKYEDQTGEIWGIPERHPEGWIVTICYPEER